MSNYSNLDVAHEGAVAIVRFESESPLNALNETFIEELLEATTALAAGDDARCIVCTGSNDAFCAGADLSALAGDETDEGTLRRWAALLHDTVIQLHQARVPVVTGVNGVAAGAGFGLALVGDLVVMSDTARFEFAYPQIGLTGDGGSTFFLPRLVGLGRAKEIALLDKPIDPNRAARMGLATEVVASDEFEDRLEEIAHELARGPTWALGRTKQLLTESFNRDLASQLAAETDVIARAATTNDWQRGYAAFFGDESPSFTGE